MVSLCAAGWVGRVGQRDGGITQLHDRLFLSAMTCPQGPGTQKQSQKNLLAVSLLWVTCLVSFPIYFGHRLRQRELGSTCQPSSFLNCPSIFFCLFFQRIKERFSPKMLEEKQPCSSQYLWQVQCGPAAVQSFASQISLTNTGGKRPMSERGSTQFKSMQISYQEGPSSPLAPHSPPDMMLPVLWAMSLLGHCSNVKGRRPKQLGRGTLSPSASSWLFSIHVKGLV